MTMSRCVSPCVAGYPCCDLCQAPSAPDLCVASGGRPAPFLDRRTLKIILRDPSVNPMETCITKVAPGWAQQLRKRKN